MIEEHVNKLAELQAEIGGEEKRADQASLQFDEEIKMLEKELVELREERTTARLPHVQNIEETKTTIGDLYAAIIDEWTGEQKTMIFDAGTLKFTSRGSLKIHDELYLFAELYDHITLDALIEKYLKGFNLTAVKKYMSVHELPIDVAEIEYKTTVQMEQKSG